MSGTHIATTSEVENIVIGHVRASGPVSRDSIAYYILEQAPGINDLAQAKKIASSCVKTLIRCGCLEKYDDMGDDVIVRR